MSGYTYTMFVGLILMSAYYYMLCWMWGLYKVWRLSMQGSCYDSWWDWMDEEGWAKALTIVGGIIAVVAVFMFFIGLGGMVVVE